MKMMVMGYQTCGKCGENNALDVKHCIVCGASLAGSEIVEDQEFEVSLKDELVCPGCNEILEPETRHCPYCATLIAKNAVTPSPVSNDSNPDPGSEVNIFLRLILYIASTFIPIIGIILGAIFWASGRKSLNSFGKGLLIYSLLVIPVLCLLVVILRVLEGIS